MNPYNQPHQIKIYNNTTNFNIGDQFYMCTQKFHTKVVNMSTSGCYDLVNIGQQQMKIRNDADDIKKMVNMNENILVQKKFKIKVKVSRYLQMR